LEQTPTEGTFAGLPYLREALSLTNTHSPTPGWYPDPSGSGQQRYFDGANWTDLQSAPVAYQGDQVSTKSSAAAGLLQLFFGWFGLGRFYVGSPIIGVIQLVIGLIGIFTTWLIVGFFILGALSIWTFIDAIMLFSGAVRDGEGRKLR
jgi:TM2 domain-containing membrane protein YozV